MNRMDPMAIIRNPAYIKILVAGGPGAFMGLVSSAAIGGTSWVTKKIELPSNWNKLVEQIQERHACIRTILGRMRNICMFDHDVIIIGGGPAGLTAGNYLARGRYRVLVLEKDYLAGNSRI